MEYILDLLKKHSIHEIAVTVQYLPDVIRRYFGDGSEFGVKLHYFEETNPLGTAGSVKNAQPFLDEPFIVISGDALTDFDLSAAVEFHRSKQSLATLVLTQVANPLEYGVVMTDGHGQVVRFLEKPSWGEVFSDTVNTGIYILEPEVLERFDSGQEYDFSNQLFPGLLQDAKPMYGYIAEGYWSDIGNLQQYRQTQFDMLDGRVKAQIRGQQVQPGIYIGDNVTVSPNVKWIGPAFIGDSSHLDDDVEIGEYCIIGKSNKLSKGSTLHRTILWDNNHIAEQNEMSGSTLASQIQCKESSQLADGSVVGSHCIIGPKSVIQANVKVWPKKQVPGHSSLSSSLIWGDQSGKSLYKASGVCGTPNQDMTPEFAARFATAYGSAAGPGKTLCLSCSSTDFTKILKRTVAAGLQSVGVHIMDIGEVLPSAARFGILQLGADGGIHIHFNEEQNLVYLECYDAAGLPVSKSAERKAENSFWQEDYSRASVDKLGQFSSISNLAGSYISSLLAVIGVPAPESERYRVVAAAGPGIFSLLHPLLEALGCEVLHLPAQDQLSSLAAFVQATKADLGCWLADDGRSMELVTRQGERITGDRLTILQYLSFFHHFNGAVIGAPVSAPHLLESLAEGLGCRIVRTKEHIRNILEVSQEQPFHPMFDGLYALGLILRNMERSGLPVDELLRLIPSFYLQRDHVECPSEAKGKVMRKMMEQTQDRKVDLVDGIKFYHDDGWVLLLPDSDDPRFKLVVQADQPETAQALVNQYREHILNFIQ
jgi:mannose-1-phosphate guanylyltransferase/phosphomannomutase